jgi:hypothetical protein
LALQLLFQALPRPPRHHQQMLEPILWLHSINLKHRMSANLVHRNFILLPLPSSVHRPKLRPTWVVERHPHSVVQAHLRLNPSLAVSCFLPLPALALPLPQPRLHRNHHHSKELRTHLRIWQACFDLFVFGYTW